MRSTDALCVYVIDRSGSMGGKELATAEGFNGFVKEQAQVEGTAYISLVLFDNEIDVPVDPVSGSKFVAWKAQDLPEMTVPCDDDGVPLPIWRMSEAQAEAALAGHRLPMFVRGSTALRDAVMTAIIGAEEWLKNHSWFDGHVIISTITDGGENASHEFQPSDLRAKMEEKQAAGWNLIFQGGSTAWLQAADFRFNEETTFEYDAATADGTAAAYASNSVGVSNLRTTGSYAGK